MKALKASVTLEDGTELLFPEMTLVELAQTIIANEAPKLDLKVSKELIEKFKKDAFDRWIKESTKLDKDGYSDLYVKLKCEEHFTEQRLNYSIGTLSIEHIKERQALQRVNNELLREQRESK